MQKKHWLSVLEQQIGWIKPAAENNYKISANYFIKATI